MTIHVTHDNDTLDYYAFEKFGMSINNLTVNNVFSIVVSNSYVFDLFLKFGFDPGFPTTPARQINIYDFKLYAVLD